TAAGATRLGLRSLHLALNNLPERSARPDVALEKFVSEIAIVACCNELRRRVHRFVMRGSGAPVRIREEQVWTPSVPSSSHASQRKRDGCPAGSLRASATKSEPTRSSRRIRARSTGTHTLLRSFGPTASRTKPFSRTRSAKANARPERPAAATAARRFCRVVV